MREEEYYNNYGEMDKETYTINKYLNNPIEQKRYEEILHLIPEDIETLLDVGSGQGIFLHHLKKRPQINATGLERACESNQIAKSLFQPKLIQADAKRIPLKTQSQDLVTVLEVLEHIPDETYKPVIEEIQRVAKDWILISVPFNEDRLIIKCPQCGFDFNPSYHFRTFDEQSLVGLFSDFEPVTIKKHHLKAYPIGYNFLRKFYIRWLERSFPDMTVCPSCGFRNSTVEEKRQTQRIKLQKWMKSDFFWIPHYKKHQWIISLYKRKEDLKEEGPDVK